MDGVENVDANHNTGIVTVNVKEDLDIAKIKEKIESKYQKMKQTFHFLQRFYKTIKTTPFF